MRVILLREIPLKATGSRGQRKIQWLDNPKLTESWHGEKYITARIKTGTRSLTGLRET